MENNTATYTEKQMKAVKDVKAKAASQGANPTPAKSEVVLDNGVVQLAFDSPDGTKTVIFSITADGAITSVRSR
jgi:hypothetical protein